MTKDGTDKLEACSYTAKTSERDARWHYFLLEFAGILTDHLMF